MSSNRSFISYFFVFFLFIAVYWGVTYTADWVNYESFFDGKQESRDIGFAYLTELFNDLDADYIVLFRFHIVLMAGAFLHFMRKINAPAWILIVFLFINYVALGNQIRYYVALPLTFLALYEYVIKKNPFTYLLFTIASVLMHFSILIFHLCFFIVYYLSLYLHNRLLFFIYVVNIVGFFLLVSGLGFQERYVEYLSEERTSTWIGGIYNFLPSLISILSIIKIKQYVDSEYSNDYSDNNGDVVDSEDKGREDEALEDEDCGDDDDGTSVNNDVVFYFLFILSISTSLLILPSLPMQILCNRFITPCFTVWLAFGIKAFSYSAYYRWRILFLLSLIVIVPVLWTFVFPFVFGIEPHFLIEAALMIESYEL